MTTETTAEVRKPIITKIPKRKTRGNSVNMLTPQAKIRAAAYARVSSDKDSQEESFQGQCDYYTNFIQKNPDWEFVELYADEAKSGLMTKKRDGFNRMVEDALAGKIDMIVTKSLSRFARNTTDTLNTVRKLTAIGVVFFFEKENIRTDNSTGEVLITILSSLAQEESNSISRNIKLGLQHRMESGKLGVNCGHLYGYEKSEDGKPQIIEDEAAVVRRIYEMCLNGYSICKIAKTLTDEGIEPPGKGKKWYDVTVKSILHNERYIGDLLCQKTVVPNYLTKEIVRNDNHEAQFYLEDSHIPIIDKDTYKRVQGILGDNKVGKRSPKLFAKRIICGDCGDLYTSVIWHCGHHAYQKEKWRCSGKYKKENHSKCTTPAVDDELLQMVFVEAFNIKMCSITSNMEMAKMLGDACNNVFSTTDVESEIAELDIRMEQLDAEIRALLSDRTAIGLDKLSAEYATAQAKIAELTEERERCNSNKIAADKFTAEVSNRTGLLTAFDEALFREVAYCFIVNSDGSVTVRFRDSSEVVVRKEAIV